MDSRFKRWAVIVCGWGGMLLLLITSHAPAYAAQWQPPQDAPKEVTKEVMGQTLAGSAKNLVRRGGGPMFSNPAPVQTCGEAIARAEQRYGTPAGLLTAIAVVETGRRDPHTGVVTPWPWSVNADNTSWYFATEAEAIAWVRDAQAHGTASIDVGCMQVNLFYHPQAFASVDEAFDPAHNADYAARFLMQLCAESGSWVQATGFYHSRTSDLALGYRRQVASVFTRAVVAVRDQLLPRLRLAWAATLPTASRLQELKVPELKVPELRVQQPSLQTRITGTTGSTTLDHHDASAAPPNDLALDTGSCWRTRADLIRSQELGQGQEVAGG